MKKYVTPNGSVVDEDTLRNLFAPYLHQLHFFLAEGVLLMYRMQLECRYSCNIA